MTKNEQIKESLRLTREKRLTQDCKVFELKLISNSMNKYQREFFKKIVH